MLKNDEWIKAMSIEKNLITPFCPENIRQVLTYRSPESEAELIPVVSFGLSSYGYDIRLSDSDFRVFRHIPGTVVDPKNFNPLNLEKGDLKHSEDGSTYFILPANSYALGVSKERIVMPPNATALCLGKSTYARIGVIANLTPLEAGWEGYITLEFSNSSSADCRIYANEGVVQLLFFEGKPCSVTYKDRKGKYQDQSNSVITATV